MAENGKKIAMAIGIYLLVKQFVNVMLGASIFSMLIPFVISVFFYLNLSEYTNYIAGQLFYSFFTGISIYLIVKDVFNLILGGSFIHLIISVVCVVLLFLGASGTLKYANAIVASAIALISLRYLPQNVSGLPNSFVYLAEGVIDLVCAVLLIFSSDVKAYFNQSN